MNTTGTQFNGEVRDLSQGGLGVVNGPDGCVYFVAGTWPGDAGTFEVLSQKKRYGFAKVVSLHTRSEHRHAQVPCPHHGTEDGSCGGCPWIPFTYADQVKRKDHLVRYALERAKVLGDAGELLPTLASPLSLGYRNRAQLKTDGQRLGFVSHQNKTLVDVDHCAVLNDECSRRLTDLRAQLPNDAWRPSGRYLWNYVEINDQSEWKPEEVALNTRLPFLQGNHDQNEAMRDWLRQQLRHIGGTHDVVELFCGAGNFTEILAEAPNVNSIVAAEISESSVNELSERRLPKTQTLAWNLFKPSAWNRIKHLVANPSLLFLDPPREGFENIDDFMERFPSVDHVLYVSCSLSTFTRDAAKLLGRGFKVSKVQPIDMFPNTPHIEICAHFYR
ncbi:MAG TPA: class I SAM-dependent RNA methyltransferase [Bdellovibrionota bacterium]|jgi:23S rRNA (uracil1939-C5)-methyltransferase|nr:class I SAM-dependent RNA methyltransferase [Bdellovibrionota bacterium]